MKERAPGQRWGLIAPISVDPASRVDRLRVLETVQAYCTEHSLQFAALILLPPTYVTSELTTPQSAHTSSEAYRRQFALSLADESAWAESISRELTEPVEMIQDCAKLLRTFRAHVIMVSGCSRGRFPGKFACRNCAMCNITQYNEFSGVWRRVRF